MLCKLSVPICTFPLHSLKKTHARHTQKHTPHTHTNTHNSLKKLRAAHTRCVPCRFAGKCRNSHQSVEFNMENAQTGNCARPRSRGARAGCVFGRCSTKQCTNFLPVLHMHTHTQTHSTDQNRGAHHHQKCKCNMRGNGAFRGFGTHSPARSGVCCVRAMFFFPDPVSECVCVCVSSLIGSCFLRRCDKIPRVNRVVLCALSLSLGTHVCIISIQRCI